MGEGCQAEEAVVEDLEAEEVLAEVGSEAEVVAVIGNWFSLFRFIRQNSRQRQ